VSIMGDIEAAVAERGALAMRDLLEALPYTASQIRSGVGNLTTGKRIERFAGRYVIAPPATLADRTQRRALMALRAMGPGRRLKANELAERLPDIAARALVMAVKNLILAGYVRRSDDGWLSVADARPNTEPNDVAGDDAPDAAEQLRADEPVLDPAPPQAAATGAPAKGNGAEPDRAWPADIDRARKVRTLERLLPFVAEDIAAVLSSILAEDLSGARGAP